MTKTLADWAADIKDQPVDPELMRVMSDFCEDRADAVGTWMCKLVAEFWAWIQPHKFQPCERRGDLAFDRRDSWWWVMEGEEKRVFDDIQAPATCVLPKVIYEFLCSQDDSIWATSMGWWSKQEAYAALLMGWIRNQLQRLCIYQRPKKDEI